LGRPRRTAAGEVCLALASGYPLLPFHRFPDATCLPPGSAGRSPGSVSLSVLACPNAATQNLNKAPPLKFPKTPLSVVLFNNLSTTEEPLVKRSVKSYNGLCGKRKK